MNVWDTLYQEPLKLNPGFEYIFHNKISEFIPHNRPVLELGCGGGANINFCIGRRYDYVGIDGSAVAINSAHTKYPSLKSRLLHLDFTNEIGLYKGYYAIIDRASVAHNNSEAIKRCIALMADILPVGGLFLSCDWFSCEHSEFHRGDFVDDHTRCNYVDGQFRSAGNVHFSNEAELRELFSGWELITLTERQTKHVAADERAHWVVKPEDGSAYTSAVWDMVWRKA